MSARTQVAVAALVAVSLILASTTVYYYYQYSQTEASLRQALSRLKGVSYTVNVLIDYGGGLEKWHNGTIVPIGASLLNTTLTIAKVEYSPSNLGAFVTSIDGVRQDPSTNRYWIWWHWDFARKSWVPGGEASDVFKAYDGAIFAWQFTDVSKWPPNPP